MRIGVVGGGIAGLMAGYRLSQDGHQVHVYEAQSQVGGQASTFSIAGNRLERLYHHLFHSDREVVALIEELGLDDRIVWHPNHGGYFYQGQIHDFVTPWDLLTFSPLPFPSRILLGLHSLYFQYHKSWRKFEPLTAREWVLKWGGQRIYDVFWGSLLRGKFGRYADEVGMAWLWGKVNVRRGGGFEYRETLGYLMGSLQPISDRLAERIRRNGGQVLVDAPVEHVAVEDGAVGKLSYRHDGQRREAEYDAVILTVPSPVALEIVPRMPQAYADQLREVPYQGAQVMVLQLSHSVIDNYWLSIADRDMPWVVVLEHTNFISPKHYQNKRIFYLSSYLSHDDPLFSTSKLELLDLYLPYMSRLNPNFDPAWVEKSWLFRDPYGQPVIRPNYSQRIPDHRTPVEGLYLANTTQIYPEDRGINYSIRLGEAIRQVVQGGDARASERW